MRPEGWGLTIVEEAEVKLRVDEATTNLHGAAEDIWEAAKWEMARHECGEKMPDTNPQRFLDYLAPNKVAKSPGLAFRYYYTKTEIVVDWVKFYDYNDAEAVAPAAYVARGR